MKQEIFITDTSREIQLLGEEFVKKILFEQKVSLSKNSARVIALYGELGSGKTTFVQGIAKGIGIKRRIISPTFIIIRSYNIKNQSPTRSGTKIKNTNKKLKMFFHIDLYRIKNNKDIEGLGLEELMDNPQNIVAIEWAEKIERFLPKKRWDIRFEYLDEDKRRISVNIKN